MEQNRNTLRFPLRVIVGVALLGMLMSACAFPGQSSSDSTASVNSTPTVAPLRPHTVASQPSDTGKLPQGQPLPGNEIKPLIFNLAYNDTALAQDIANIYTPGSPSFHHFLTPEQVRDHYAPSDTQVQQVRNWLTQQGYTVVSTDTMHASIKVQANVATIERSLKIKLNAYDIFGHRFFLLDGIPQLPTTINGLVQSIVGLDNFAYPTFKLPSNAIDQATASAGNCSKYGAKQTLTRDKLAAAYQLNQLYKQGLQGQGMTVGVAEFDEPYDPQDVVAYAKCAGIGMPHIQNIDVDGHVTPGPGEGEAAMDLELIAGLAPQAQILDYQASLHNVSFAQALVDVFNKVATDHKVQVLSVSYGTYEGAFSPSEQAAVNRSLSMLAAEGISVFISSGDCGAYGERIKNVAVVSFPASAPYAIAVGGTHLQVNNGNIRTSETAWGSDDGAGVCQNEWGSGGGVSQNKSFKRPAWQTGAGTTAHYDGSNGLVRRGLLDFTPVSAPNGLRQVPDVSASAYPNNAIYYQGAWLAAGGTSAAAPIWAAGAVLVDQGLQQYGKAPFLGSVPEFYTLANHPGHYHPYTDITVGGNLFYNATRGWDYVTGWGTPNFADILQYEIAQ